MSLDLDSIRKRAEAATVNDPSDEATLIREDIPALLDRVEALEKALEFYADPKTWAMRDRGILSETLIYTSDAEQDSGDRARTTLRGDGGGKGGGRSE